MVANGFTIVSYYLMLICCCCCCLSGNRKKYVKSCQIRHTYGEDDEANLLEEEAILVAENAVQAGSECDITVPGDHVVDPPETATVTLGGKKCKWCGSTTHSRKTHKDCPHNPKYAPTST